MTVFTPAQPSPPHAVASAPQRASRVDVAQAARIVTPHGSRAQATPATGPRFWPTWITLTVFVFIGFECILLGAALRGSWYILMAPGLVCAVKAWDAWRTLQKASNQ